MAKVLGLHTVELKPGVDAHEFEAFVNGQVIPLYQRVPGQTIHLYKGDRGERKGKYLVVVELDSPEVRDQLYPVEGHGVGKEFEQALAGTEPIFEKLGSLIVEFPDPHNTDYELVKA